MQPTSSVRIALVVFAGLFLAMPAAAQVDLSGTWTAVVHEDQPERGPGPELGDYLGLPINAAAQLRGEAYDAALLTLPEWQCRPHPADYGVNHSHHRLLPVVDNTSQAIVAWDYQREWQQARRTFHLGDVQAPPEFAPHTWQGFSVARWEGNALRVDTTHLKAGYTRRNGMARSDKATLREYYVRHGDYMTVTSILTDPVYLTEPLVRTRNFRLDPNRRIAPYPCLPAVEVERAKGAVPHHLPGQNPYISEFAAEHGLPLEAAMGGADTMYPEYQQKLKTLKPAERPQAPRATQQQ